MGTFAVTGSAGGIGGAIKARIESEGHRVIGVDVRDATIEADLATADGRQAAIRAISDTAGPALDGLVLCAGLGPTAPSAVIAEVNYFGAIELLDGLRDTLEQATNPAVVAISSNSVGTVPPDDLSLVGPMLDNDREAAVAAAEEAHPAAVYAMSKLAVARAVRRRAPTWGEAGIRVNAVCPGAVDTPLLQATLEDPELGEATKDFPIPLGRRGTPDEIAELVWFILGPHGSWMSGSVVFLDGGSDALIRPDAP